MALTEGEQAIVKELQEIKALLKIPYLSAVNETKETLNARIEANK